MTKSRLIIFITLLFCTNANAIQFRIEDSKTLALWSFVLGATSAPIGSASSVEFYKKSSLHGEKIDRLLDEAAQIIEKDLNQGFNFQKIVPGRSEQGWDSKKHFLLQAAIAKSLKDFKLHTSDLLPYVKHKRLFEILNELMPVYEKIIWNPYRGKISKIKSKLIVDFNKLKKDDTLGRISNFYQSSVDPSSIFKVHLIPVPGSRGGTHSTVVSNEIFAQVLMDCTPLDADAGTLVHETAHYLYETQPQSFQEEHLTWFDTKNAVYGNFLYQSWDEILATVTGNGYGYEVVHGIKDKNEWYQNHEFETISRAIYPNLKEYLKNRKKLDRAFVEDAKKKFAELLPNAELAFARIFRSTILLLEDSVKINDFKNPFKRTFHYHSLDSEPLDRTNDIAKDLKRGHSEYSPDEPYASIVIVAQNLATNSDIHKLDIPQGLKARIKSIQSSKPGYLAYFEKNSLPIILIQGSTEAEFANIDRVLRKKYALKDEQVFHEVYE